MTDRAVTAAFDTRFHRSATYAIDQCPTRPLEVTPLARGNRKQTAIVRFADRDPMVLQLCATPRWLTLESVLLERIADRTTVPVPPVYTSGTVDDIAYLLTEYVPGDDLHTRFTDLEAATRRTLTTYLGRALAELHEAFQFSGYGQLAVADGSLVTSRERWTEWFTEYALEAIRRLPDPFDPLRADLEALITDAGAVDNPPACLYAWDFRPGNMLIDEGTITAIVDWEAPCAAPASLAVANAEHIVVDWYGVAPKSLRESFIEGYSSVRPYPVIRPEHRAAVVADSAVDSHGVVTNPRYPELDHAASVAFHRRRLEAVIDHAEQRR